MRKLSYWANSGSNPFATCARPTSDFQKVRAQLEGLDIPAEEYRIDPDSYQAFRALVPDSDLRHIYGDGLYEKPLEHFISFSLMGLNQTHRYIDIASLGSPYPRLFGQLSGCMWFRQDLVYPPGVLDHTIGGNACELPIPDSSVDRLTMHCSFEHFEGDYDRNFMVEAARVLKPGGMLVIVPLYITETYYILTDPVKTRNQFAPDPGADVVVDYAFGNRFGRHYSPSAFWERIAEDCPLALRLLMVENAREIHPSCYVKFVGVFTKSTDAPQ